MHQSDDPEAADVFDFVDEFLSDREKGRERPLAHYLARYPRCQEAIAREFLAFKTPGLDEPSARTPSVGPSSADPDESRIGPYRILSEIGRGGQGAVFLAQDTRIARRVALKVLASRSAFVTDERLRRFRREAEVIARLEHPGICGIYDAEIDGESPYIAMRHVDGKSLAQILSEARTARSRPLGHAPASSTAAAAASPNSDLAATWPPGTPLDVHRVLLMFERVARALHAAHEAGVVHRDVKPGNIMVALDGKPVLLDFGLARDEQSEVATVTQSGEVFGTPAYMSPEQLSGGEAHLDRTTDVYSLAVSMYETLTLVRPFEAPSRLELYRRIREEPPPDARRLNPRLSEDVAVVLETALERDRERRYATALDLAEDLRRIREYEPIRARPAGVWLRFSRWTRRHPALAVSIIGTILSLSGGLALALYLLEKRDVALRKADSALETALGHHLAERCVALIPEDPALALAVGVEAAEREIRQDGVARGANYLTRSALFQALDACWLEHVLSGEPARLATDVAASPDGRTLALATDGGVARVFDLETGAALFDLKGHSGAIARILYAPDGAWIATVSADGKARILDARTGELVREMDAGDPLLEADISPDGARLVAVGRGGSAVVWNTATGERAFVLDQGPGGVEWAAFRPRDGTLLLTRAAPRSPKAGLATLWDARAGRLLRDLDAGPSPVVACAFDPVRDRVAVASQDGGLHVFEIPTGERARPSIRLGAPADVLTFSPEGDRLLLATDRGKEGDTLLFDIATGERRLLTGHEGRRVVHGAFSPDGARVATASFDMTTRVWNAADGAELRALAALVRPVGVLWTRDGKRLVTLNKERFVHVWFARNRPDLFDLAGHFGAVVRARFAPDDRTALTASADGTARLWSVPATAGPVAVGAVRDPEGRPIPDLEPGALLHVLRHEGPVTDACFGPDGDRVLTVSADGTGRLWSTRTGQPTSAPLVHPAPVLAGAFDSRGARVLTVCADGKARIFAQVSEAQPRVLDSAAGAVLCAAFDPRGEIVACGGEGDAVGIWDAESGERLRELRFERGDAIEGGVSALAFDPASGDLAAGCGDKKVRFWNPRTGAHTRPDAIVFAARSLSYSADGTKLLVIGLFGGGAAKVFLLREERAAVQAEITHTASVTGGVLSTDGSFVLTTARDGTAHVWEAATGRPIAHRSGGKAAILDAAFDAGISNPRVITAREDGTVSIWPVDPLPAARARKPRDLYPLEKAREQRLALPLIYE